MNSPGTTTKTETFTIAHAKRMASKVGTELTRLRRLYSEFGAPDEPRIALFESEIAELLKAGFLKCVSYGFRKNGEWLFALKYHAAPDGSLASDDVPGKVRPSMDFTVAPFLSFLEYDLSFYLLSGEARASFEAGLPLQRSAGTEPGIAAGYWSEDLTYSAGERALKRSTLKRY